MSKYRDARPYIDEIDRLLKQVNAIPEHFIVDEKLREAYKHGLLDVKGVILDMVETDGW